MSKRDIDWPTFLLTLVLIGCMLMIGLWLSNTTKRIDRLEQTIQDMGAER